ncbi:MAG: winged helix-turn-helix transcriptional regulator [Saprospiraceae bacterium]
MVTNADNQDDSRKEKVKVFFKKTIDFTVQQGFCPIRELLASALDKWSLLVIYFLSYQGVLRFNELKKYIPDVSSRMLSVTLKKLEKNQIVERKVFAEVPPRVEYRLTDFGATFSEKLIHMSDWVVDNFDTGKNKNKK